MSSAILHPIDTLVDEVMQANSIPGLALGVTLHGRNLHTRGYGVMNLETRAPVTAETLFHLASVTKLFVGTAIVQLADRGLVELDAPVARYLPYFRLDDARYAQITVEQMLTHTSGMPDTDEYGWEHPEYDDGALERYVRSLAGLQLLSTPGEAYAYSNIAFEVLGDLIAKVVDTTFEEYVRRHILAPLSMRRSTLLVREADPTLLATPHEPGDSGEVQISTVFPYNRAHAPSSTLYSNVAELNRWSIAQLNRGELEGVRILPDAAYDTLWTSRSATGDKYLPEIGLTWYLADRHGYRFTAHDGSDVGFKCALRLVPAAHISVVVLSNLDRAPVEDLSEEIMDVVVAGSSPT
jgi:CubicO group peptidase (beta-lactamase class C family)